MALWLVTGGAGFIGSHTVDELLERGASVRVLDDFSTGRRDNLQAALGHIDLIEGDVAGLGTVREAVDGVDYVVHLAALPSVARSVEDPVASNRANVVGTVNVLVAARDAGVRRVVYASSSSVYGDRPTLPKHEEMVTVPLSPYAVSKLAGEHYCQAFHRVYGLQTVALRYFNVFGPRQDPRSQYSAVIPKFIAAVLRGEPPEIHGDGHQSRDFTYVANVVQANLLACESPDGIGEVFNVGCGERHTLLELVSNLQEIMRSAIEPRFTDARPGDVRHSLADISRIERAMGYEPEVSFREGLRSSVEWYSGRGSATTPR
jgi:nucleoside-diphosphate-sugar epimerase